MLRVRACVASEHARVYAPTTHISAYANESMANHYLHSGGLFHSRNANDRESIGSVCKFDFFKAFPAFIRPVSVVISS